VIGGRKTFETVFIPAEAGEFVIPGVAFSFFNPTTRTYQTLATRAFTIKVQKSDQVFALPAELSRNEAFKMYVEAESRDIHFIDEEVPDPRKAILFRHAIGGLAAAEVLLVVLLFYGFWQIRQDRIFEKDNALKRRLFARSQAAGRMGKIKKLARSRRPDGTAFYFEEIDKVLTQYLTDKFGLSVYGVTREALQRHLLGVLGEKDPLFLEIVNLYRVCDESRFARAAIDHSQKSAALKTLRRTIEKVEKIKKR
jgi:hypothetical protein